MFIHILLLVLFFQINLRNQNFFPQLTKFFSLLSKFFTNMGGQIMTKEEKQKQNQTMKIAKFCRFNIASKKTKLRKEEYDYFTAHDAIETLYNSKHRVKDGENVPRAERKAGALYTRDDCTLFFKHLVGVGFWGDFRSKWAKFGPKGLILPNFWQTLPFSHFTTVWPLDA